MLESSLNNLSEREREKECACVFQKYINGEINALAPLYGRTLARDDTARGGEMILFRVVPNWAP